MVYSKVASKQAVAFHPDIRVSEGGIKIAPRSNSKPLKGKSALDLAGRYFGGKKRLKKTCLEKKTVHTYNEV